MSLSITSWAFDKPVYSPGDTITLTVTYTSTDMTAPPPSLVPVTVNVSDTSGTASQVSDGSAGFPDLSTAAAGTPEPTSVSATDPRPGTWTVTGNAFSGTASPFTGTAVLTSVA